MTIANGNVSSGQNGGGILNAGSLTLAYSTISQNNASGNGGGIYSSGSGGLTVNYSTLTDNRTFGNGGAIYAMGNTLSVSNSTIFSNASGGFANGGGAIYCNVATGNIVWSTLSQNSGGLFGGAIRNQQGNLSIDHTTLSNNGTESGGGDGAVFNYLGTITLSYSTVEGNSADQGGGIYNSGATTVTNSTFDNNSAFIGGAIFGGDLEVTNSTFYGNQALAGPTVQGGKGGAIDASTLTVTSSTFNNNSAYSGIQESGKGGAVYVDGNAPFFPKNTIIAGNSADSGPDVSGTPTSRGHNLIGDYNDVSAWDPTDMVGTDAMPIDPKLYPLSDNGGFTQTQLPMADSPAVDAGDNTDAPMWDQRGEGYNRIVNGVIDIGAVERQTFDPPAPSLPTRGERATGQIASALQATGLNSDLQSAPISTSVRRTAYAIVPALPVPIVQPRPSEPEQSRNSKTLDQGSADAFFDLLARNASHGPEDLTNSLALASGF